MLVTPALADANNGNWRTAQRWARMLASDHRVSIVDAWCGEEADVLLALHARRSAASIADFARAHPDRALILALTGTDLYRDILDDLAAQRSLALAQTLIVLQEAAPQAVPAEHRHKVKVCFQSTRAYAPVVKTDRRLRAVAVGHLRDVKDPATVMRAMRRLADRPDIVFDHIGAPLDANLARAARACERAQGNYRWLGALDHARTLARIRRAHVLVHPSILEGGAHVVMEAVRAGTPVIASRMPGNVGMLGETYDGYFEVGDDAALGAMLARARDEPAWLAKLARQCAKRAPLFAPEREAATLRKIVARTRLESARTQRDAASAQPKVSRRNATMRR